MTFLMHPLSLVLLAAVVPACAQVPPSEHAISRQPRASEAFAAEEVDPDCEFPTAPETWTDEGGVVLKVWKFTLQEVHSQAVVPDDYELLAYRAAIRDYGADTRMPPLDVPVAQSQVEAAIWRDEVYNKRRVYGGEIGTIEPITCLDALIFAEQNARFSQLTHPTEFIASVLRRDLADAQEIVVVFGAGDSSFPPKSAYGIEIVAEYVRMGWRYWYMLHNHSLQRSENRIALGVPAPSTSDVQFARSLAETQGLENVRVTNGLYTFTASVDEMGVLRQR